MLFFLLFSTYTLYTQCLITKTEYDDIVKGIDEIDPIVGLWHLSGQTNIYQADTLLRSIKEPTLDYWYIVPDSSSYKVCHTDFSKVQNFTAEFSSISLESYRYASSYDTGEKVETKAILLHHMLHDIEVDKLIQYKYFVPPIKASMLGCRPEQQMEWFFSWQPVDEEWFYAIDTSIQNDFYNTYFVEDSIDTHSPKQIEQIIKTSNNTFSKEIRSHIDSGTIFNYPGSELLSDNIANDRFLIVSVNYDFPTRVSYLLTFDMIEDYMLRFDFRVDDENKLVDLISINKSLYQNKRFIKKVKSQELNKRYDFWR